MFTKTELELELKSEELEWKLQSGELELELNPWEINGIGIGIAEMELTPCLLACKAYSPDLERKEVAEIKWLELGLQFATLRHAFDEMMQPIVQ